MLGPSTRTSFSGGNVLLMRMLWIYLVGLFLSAAGAFTPLAAGPPPAREGQFLSHARQLTFEGKRSGEGYFSPDGQSLIFQSEREPDNPFYQMYILDFSSGDITRLSPGRGKSTC